MGWWGRLITLGGLSYGNQASMLHRSRPSNPKLAALQGLRKMKLLAELGVSQAIIPPLERPSLGALRRCGFSGSDEGIIKQAAIEAPRLLSGCYSASSMWTANCGIVTPSADTSDGRVHFTPANLSLMFHRSIETVGTAEILKTIFSDPQYFSHHPPVPASFSDEGAANHSRLCESHAGSGVHMFVYGTRGWQAGIRRSSLYPRRQSYEALSVIARAHGIVEKRALFLQQHTLALDSGIFHNDVISMGNESVFLWHEYAFEDGHLVSDKLAEAFKTVSVASPYFRMVGQSELSLDEALQTYFFNSQLVSLGKGKMCLLMPQECEESASVMRLIEKITSETDIISSTRFISVRQSMRNGGGPACLRFRVVLTEKELGAVHKGVLYSDSLFDQLVEWVSRYYRERLVGEDLSDPRFIDEIKEALNALTEILDLGMIYPFQN